MTRRLTASARERRRAEARLDVAVMRELGMLQWEGIVLGPLAPPPPAPARELTPEELRARVLEREQRRHDVLFAATSLKPRLRPVADQQADEDAARLARVTGGHNRVPREVISPEARGGTTTNQP